MLVNKTGIAVRRVARVLCEVTRGDRIPTVTSLVSQCEMARGNIQKALLHLQQIGAVKLESHGQNGTTLTDIDYLALAGACGVDHVVGVMPLPYTGRYEGIATGLFNRFSDFGLRTYITFLRGSEARAQSLLDGFANYSVMSRLAYQDCLRQGIGLVEVLDLGPQSYVGRHVLLRQRDCPAGWDGLRVGFDDSSADQRILTERLFEKRSVQLVPTQYTNIVDALNTGKIDVGVWNEDDAGIRDSDFEKLSVDDVAHGDDTRAVIVARADDALTIHLLEVMLDRDSLLSIQHDVMIGTRAACY